MVSIILTSVLKILASLVPSVERRGWRAVEVHWRELTRLVSSDFRSVRVLGAFGARLLNSYSIFEKVFHRHFFFGHRFFILKIKLKKIIECVPTIFVV